MKYQTVEIFFRYKIWIFATNMDNRRDVGSSKISIFFTTLIMKLSLQQKIEISKLIKRKISCEYPILLTYSRSSFGPTLMESDWYNLVSRVLEAMFADERKGTGEVARKANADVRRHGMRGTVLSKIASATEERSDVPGVMMSGQREEIIKATNRASQGIMNENLSR